MSFHPYINKQTVNGKFVAVGSFFLEAPIKTSTIHITVPPREKQCQYLVQISLTMLSAEGGDFDDCDAVWADIYSIDRMRLDSTNSFGGVWDSHFESIGSVRNKAISSYIGKIDKTIMFRLSQEGDNWVGASFIILQL